MLFFSHTGITLGTALLLARLTMQYPGLDIPASEEYSRPEYSPTEKDLKKAARPSFVSSLTHHVDLRLLLVGSMLPDIIDKPLGHLIFRETISNGRIFSHTGLFLIIFSSLGLFLYRRFSRTGLLVLSFGIAMHLVLDQMWREYHTLAWPAFGFSFEKNDIANWIPEMFSSLFKNPQAYIPEVIGIVVIGLFTYWLISKKQLLSFIRKGKVLSK